MMCAVGLTHIPLGKYRSANPQSLVANAVDDIQSLDLSETVQKPLSLPHMSNLRILILVGVKFVASEDFSALRNLPSLNILDLSHSNLDDHHLSHVIALLPEYMHTLDISYCTNITMAARKILAVKPKLGVFKIGTCISREALLEAKERRRKESLRIQEALAQRKEIRRSISIERRRRSSVDVN